MSLVLNATPAFSAKNLTTSVQLMSYASGDKEYTVGVRVDLGAVGGYLSAAASQITIECKVDGKQAYIATVTKPVGSQVLYHNVDRLLYVRPAEVLTVWALSDNVAETAVKGNVYIFGARSSGGTLVINERSDMVDWIKTEFGPFGTTLGIDDDVIN